MSDELAQLTHRERHVLQHIVIGLGDEEIAERLLLIPGVVRSHVEHILTKAGLHDRAQIVGWAVQHGLYRPKGPRENGEA
jgi:DNA-binding NarL/FixJ family response regulator